MKSNVIDVIKVAKLANLTLSKSEEEVLEKQLDETLKYVESLNSIDTTNVEPTSQVTGLENVLREDQAAPSLSSEEALGNTKQKENGFFKIKAVLES